MQRPARSNGSQSGGWRREDDDVFIDYPLLAAYLVDTKYDDGGPREPSALVLSIQDGQAHVALNDKDLKQSLYAAAGGFLEAMRILEEALAAGSGRWRPWKFGKKTK